MQEQSSQIAAIVLAAGKGTRMKSQKPKVLHPVCGTPMLGRVLHSLQNAGIKELCVVIGGDIEPLQTYLKAYEPITLTMQTARLGTGEAVACAGYGFEASPVPSYASGHWISGSKISSSHLLICAGDTPALNPDILTQFLAFCANKKSSLAVLAMQHPHPQGYGRILQDDKGQLLGIVEEKDASPAQKNIQICNSGVIFAKRELLFSLLSQLTRANAQNEYYLTDCFQLARTQGLAVDVWITDNYRAFDGVNDRRQLAQSEQYILQQIRDKWMLNGVSFVLPETCYIEDSVEIGPDTQIGPHCSLIGKTRIGRFCEIGSHVHLKDVMIADSTQIAAGTIKA